MSRDQDRENEARFGATPFPAKLGWLWPDKGFMRNPLLALPRTIFTVVARILGINSMLVM